jgi:hypothetical protein
MRKSKVIQPNPANPQSRGLVLATDKKKRLVDFFSILIEIDRRKNITGVYDKPTS